MPRPFKLTSARSRPVSATHATPLRRLYDDELDLANGRLRIEALRISGCLHGPSRDTQHKVAHVEPLDDTAAAVHEATLTKV